MSKYKKIPVCWQNILLKIRFCISTNSLITRLAEKLNLKEATYLKYDHQEWGTEIFSPGFGSPSKKRPDPEPTFTLHFFSGIRNKTSEKKEQTFWKKEQNFRKKEQNFRKKKQNFRKRNITLENRNKTQENLSFDHNFEALLPIFWSFVPNS